MNVSSNNALYSGIPISVEFNSSCVSAGKASFSISTVSTSTGTASTVYQAEGCVGADTISATVDSASASVRVTVSAAEVNSIGFSSLSAASISYSNSSSSTQSNIADISFALQDDRGNPVEGRTVTFAISSNSTNHGLTLSNVSSVSDAEGLVSTRLNAGTAAVNARVVATYSPSSGNDIATQSPPIAVNTGPTDVDSFSLSVGGASVNGALSKDGVTTTIVTWLGDRHNNPVADGTVVSFWTEYGIIPATCVTANGSCQVDWKSAGERPIDGLSTVVAYTTGEDSFIDAGRRNGVYNIAGEVGLSVDETLIVQSELYFDLNYDGFDPAGTSFVDAGSGKVVDSDRYEDYNGNGSFEATSAKYRGSLCSAGAIAALHCAEQSVQVWDSTQLCLIDNRSAPNAVVQAGPWTAGNSYTIDVSDSKGNFPPPNTSVVASPLGSASAEIDIKGAVPSLGGCGSGSFSFIAFVDSVTTAGTYKLIIEIPGAPARIEYVTVN